MMRRGAGGALARAVLVLAVLVLYGAVGVAAHPEPTPGGPSAEEQICLGCAGVPGAPVNETSAICDVCCTNSTETPPHSGLYDLCCTTLDELENKYCNGAGADTGLTTEDKGLLLTLGIAVAVYLIAVLLFSFLRTRFRVTYMPRTYKFDHRSKDPPATFFGWLKALPLLRWSDEQQETQMMESRGLEAVMLLRFMKMGMVTAVFFGLWAWAINASVYGTGPRKDLDYWDPLLTRGSAVISTANLAEESARWTCVLVTVYCWTAFVCAWLYYEYSHYVKLRNLQLSRELVQNYAVIVTELPMNRLKGLSTKDANKMVFDTFTSLCGRNTVVSAVVAWKDAKMGKALGQFNTATAKLERAEAILKAEGERPTHKDGPDPCGCTGDEVDSIDHWRSEREKAAETLTQAQNRASPAEGFHPIAFVTFRTKRAAALASQTQLMRDKHVWRTWPAPDPADVAWGSNLAVTDNKRYWITVGVNTFMTLLVFFWMIPVAFVAGLVNLEELAKTTAFSWLEPIVGNAAGAFVASFLPVLVYIIFFALLLLIISSVTALQGFHRNSWLMRSVRNKYFYFLIFNVLLGTSIMGSLLAQIDSLIKGGLTFNDFIALLGTGLPAQTYFFLNYVIMKGLIGFGMQLLRPAPLILRPIFQRFLCKTEKERLAAEFPGAFAYHKIYAEVLLVFTVSILYAILQPIMTLYMFVYFLAGFVSIGYNTKFVFVQPYDLGGFLFQGIVSRVLFGSFLVQILVFAVMLLNRWGGAFGVIPLCFLTLWFYIYVDRAFDSSVQYAGAVDRSEPHFDEKKPLTLFTNADADPEQPRDLRHAYNQPTRRPVSTAADQSALDRSVASYYEDDGDSASATVGDDNGKDNQTELIELSHKNNKDADSASDS